MFCCVVNEHTYKAANEKLKALLTALPWQLLYDYSTKPRSLIVVVIDHHRKKTVITTHMFINMNT
jgi:hypothetical protein